MIELCDDDKTPFSVGKVNFSTDLGSCDIIIQGNIEKELFFILKNGRDSIRIKAFHPEYIKDGCTRFLNSTEKDELQQYLESNTKYKHKDSNWRGVIASLNIHSFGDFPEQDHINEQVMPNYRLLEE